MRHVLASACILLLATRAVAAQEPTRERTIDWSMTPVTAGVTLPGQGPDRATAVRLQATAPGPTSFHLVTIDHLAVVGPAYVVAGQVRYQDVDGQGYLEMWTVFPDGQRFFTRTLGAQGPLAALHGESNWRRFELPFDSIHLEQALARAGKVEGVWWSERAGTLVGTLLGSFLGVVGAIIGVVGGRGKARRLVLGLLGGMIAVGGSLALVGAAAASISQPRYVWYPLLVIGGAAGVIGLVILPVLRRRFAADELRRIDALDAGSRS